MSPGTPPLYQFRYFFSSGSGICLWGLNPEAIERYGYAVDLKDLKLEENLLRRGWHLLAWFDTALDWSYPGNPSPWTKEESQRFDDYAQRFLSDVRQALGTGFEIRDESKTAAQTR